MAGSSGKWGLYGCDVFFRFDQRNHVYTAGGREVPNVTKITGQLDKPALRYWFKNQALDAVNAFLSARVGERVDEMLVNRIRDSSAYIGTTVHAWIEQWVIAHVEGNPTPAWPLSEKIRKACQRFVEWANGSSLDFTFAERKVFSREQFYAGTVDIGVAPAEASGDGRTRAIIDIKTGNTVAYRGNIYPEIRMQMAAYSAAIGEEDGAGYPRRIVVHIPARRGGLLRAYYLDEDPNAYEQDLGMFLALREFYRISEGV